MILHFPPHIHFSALSDINEDFLSFRHLACCWVPLGCWYFIPHLTSLTFSFWSNSVMKCSADSYVLRWYISTYFMRIYAYQYIYEVSGIWLVYLWGTVFKLKQNRKVPEHVLIFSCINYKALLWNGFGS